MVDNSYHFTMLPVVGFLTNLAREMAGSGWVPSHHSLLVYQYSTFSLGLRQKNTSFLFALKTGQSCNNSKMNCFFRSFEI